MDILAILKGILAAITASILALTGSPVMQHQTVAQIASSADQVIQQAVANAPETKPVDVTDAYDIGKSIGYLQGYADSQQKVAEITNQSTTTMNATSTAGSSTPTPSTGGQTSGAPVQNEPIVDTAAQQSPTSAPASQARIEVVNPIPGKGLDRSYISAPEVANESNYIEIGFVIYDDAGLPVSDATAQVVTTDMDQNKILKGTGNVMSIYIDGQKRQTPYYPFHYEFHVAGQHRIVFTANGMQKEVDVTAQ